MKNIFSLVGGSHDAAFGFIILMLFLFIWSTWKSFSKSALSEKDGTGSSARLNIFLFSILAMVLILYAVMFTKHIDDNILEFLAVAIGIGTTSKIMKDRKLLTNALTNGGTSAPAAQAPQPDVNQPA